MFISEKNPHKVLFIGKNRSNFHTLDMGVSYHPCPQIDIMDVRLHPRQPDWILASSMSEGCHPTEDGGVSEHECYKIVRHTCARTLHAQEARADAQTAWTWR